MAISVSLSISAGKVAADRTGKVVRVDLSGLPTNWWTDTTSDLGNVRVKQAGTVIPFDVVGPSVDRTAKTGVLYFRAPTLLAAAGNDFTVETVDGATALAVTDTNGRNAVFAGYTYFFDAWENADRTGNGYTLTLAGSAALTGGWLDCGASVGWAYVTGVARPAGNVWSIGITAHQAADPSSANLTVMSVNQTGSTSTSVRATLSHENGSDPGWWNSTDGWLRSPDPSITVFPAVARENAFQNGTTQRKLYRGGVLKATDNTIAARPGGSGTIDIVLGSADTTANGRWNGKLTRAYLRPSIPTDDEVAEENASWESPATFYTITTGTVISGGTAHETDAAQAGTVTEGPVAVTGGTGHETDTAHAGSVVQATVITGGTGHETDTLHPGAVTAGASTVSGGTAGETDVAHAGTVETTDPVDPDAFVPVGFGFDVAASLTVDAVPPPVVDDRVAYTLNAWSIPVPDLVHGRPDPDLLTAEVAWATADLGHERLLVGGKDVTIFRDLPFVVEDEQNSDPFGSTTASYTLPGLTAWEIDQWRTGSLAWMGPGRKVVRQLVRDGVVVETLWRGFIINPRPADDGDGVTIECSGHAAGRLAAAVKKLRPFPLRLDAGRLLYDMARNEGDLRIYPVLGPTTGKKLDQRSVSGGSQLDAINDVAAKGQADDGRTLTVLPEGLRRDRYRIQYRDRDRIDATVFFGSYGVRQQLTTDLLEQPRSVYGVIRRADGGLVGNFRAPNLIQGEIPDFPGTLTFGDTGPGVEALQNRLWGQGYMSRVEALGGYGATTVDAVEELQEHTGLPVTGVTNLATWRAAFDLSRSGTSILQSFQAPFAQDKHVRRINRTASGFAIEPNPDYDPDEIDVQVWKDGGLWNKPDFTKWARQQICKPGDPLPWAGTITLEGVDLFPGDYHHGDPLDPADLISWRRPLEGIGLMFRGWDGDRLFHISNDQKSASAATLSADTRFRPALEVEQALERDAESRARPGRTWMRQHKGTETNGLMGWLAEIGGILEAPIHCPGDTWTTFWMPVGDMGTIGQIRAKLDVPRELALIVVGKPITDRWANRNIGNPFTNKFKGERIDRLIDNERVLLYSAGITDAPGGYGPNGSKEDGDPLTGIHLDAGGFEFRTWPDGQEDFASTGIVWLGIRPKGGSANLVPGRWLWPTAEVGM